MNHVSSSTPNNGAATGAFFMIAASLAFAGSNLLQSALPTPVEYGGYGMSSTGMAFWQYVIASLLALPLILRIGLGNLRTSHPVAHQIRAFVSALGVHVFVYGFATGVPIWQMVTLLATGPLFIILGSTLFLGERASAVRIGAALVGFVGAIIVSGVGAESLSSAALIPIVAAALWATTDVLTKYLSKRGERPETLTISLLVLVTPNHLLILIAVWALGGVAPGLLPAGLADNVFALPGGTALALLVLLGALTAAAQYLLAIAYKAADATYLQPFGDLKVPLSGLLGWVILSQVPGDLFWAGAALILAASLFILWAETDRRPKLSVA
ncbi:MAG: DMT family transporter [Alphaproteobacteria bacterium]|nr:DMT family transporter [Alphaproteobacteria bacterium]MBU1559284.1 DMT family transporter [Alphaproteobacteria bacterium]MBU2304685.1 DMT family transporter [Alphaproteobacteria bacterium]MBU2369928.1 DMT family transporter [Alphaproteobacteria bacterium]